MMEKMKSRSAHGKCSSKGLWDCPEFKYSKDTLELMQEMMRESRLSNFQQRQINDLLNKGGALPLVQSPASSAPAEPEPRVSKRPVLSSRPQKRSAEKCSAGDNYIRERFLPSATRNLEKEKRRLQNIFATGQDEPQPSPSLTRSLDSMEDIEKDRFQEVLDEIEERRQFLDEMNALGRGSQYHHVINSQISQKIRELELIDRERTEALKTLTGKKENGEVQR